MLERWTEARARDGEGNAVVLGDWNPRLASRGDAFLSILNDDPEGSVLNLASGDQAAGCKARYREYIDFIATGAAATARLVGSMSAGCGLITRRTVSDLGADRG